MVSAKCLEVCFGVKHFMAFLGGVKGDVNIATIMVDPKVYVFVSSGELE
jgi:hypothetical protein